MQTTAEPIPIWSPEATYLPIVTNETPESPEPFVTISSSEPMPIPYSSSKIFQPGSKCFYIRGVAH